MAAVYSSQFGRTLGLPGFPEVRSFLDFILPGSIVQAVSFGATSAGTALALDIEDGFFDRLMASPVSRVPILLGRLGGAAVIAAGKAIILILIFLAFGAQIKAGIGGALIIILTASLLVLAIGGFGSVHGYTHRIPGSSRCHISFNFRNNIHVISLLPDLTYGRLVSALAEKQSNYLDY